MTTAPQIAPQIPEIPVPEPAPFQVAPRSNSRLAQLHATYYELKAAVDAATERFKAVSDAIKVELNQAAPDSRRVDLVGKSGPPLRLGYSESWRVDSTRLKREAPEVYVAYAKKSGSWRLAPVRGGAESEE